MSERMSDRDLARLDKPGIGDDVRMMAREIIARRLVDLTANDYNVIRWLIDQILLPLQLGEQPRAGIAASDIDVLRRLLAERAP